LHILDRDVLQEASDSVEPQASSGIHVGETHGAR